MSAASSRSDPAAGWQASLALGIERRGARSVLARREHRGPLRVQKALYPEGDEVCQILVLHPPAGIAGGDQLELAVEVGRGAHAQLSTPGAGKWYRSAGAPATQHIRLKVAGEARLEWLPQEVIVFDSAQALSRTVLRLAPGARSIGWDIVCLGRTASGERFERGFFDQALRVEREDGAPLWQERLRLEGSDPALASAIALGGHPVFATMWLAGVDPDPALNAQLREISIAGGVCGVSALPGITLLRVVAHSSEAVRNTLEQAWTIARPTVLAREAIAPRIWRT